MNQCELIWQPVFQGIQDITSFLLGVAIFVIPAYLAYAALDKALQRVITYRTRRLWRNVVKKWMSLKQPQIDTPIKALDIFCIKSDFVSSILWVILIFFSWWGNVICPLAVGAEWNSQFFSYSVVTTFVYVLLGSIYVRRVKALSHHLFERSVQYG